MHLINNDVFMALPDARPDLRGDEFLGEVKEAYKDFDKFLDKQAANEIGTFSLIVYADTLDPNNRGAQISIRKCDPNTIIDSVVQTAAHLVFDIAKTDREKLQFLHALKLAVIGFEKVVMKDIKTANDLFKD